MSESAHNYLAGAATAVVTPREPMWLAGWAVRRSPSRGTISDLHAKALALQDADGKQLVIVTADLIAIPPEVSAAVAAAALRTHGIPRERVLLNASHTHCGPEVRPDKVEFFKIPPEHAAKIGPYVEWLTAMLVKLVDGAIRCLSPARLTAREATATFAVNRRKVSHGVDHHVPVLEVTSRAGLPIAILFNYACHNTVIDPQDGRFCGDWAGFAQARLEREFPGATAFFTAGAGADQHAEPRFTVELSQRYGDELAAAVGRSLREDPGRVVSGGLAAAYEQVPLAYEPLPAREQLEANLSTDDEPLKTKSRYLLRAMDEGRAFGPTYPCPLQVVRLGDELVMIALGGEPVVDYAHLMRRAFAGGPVVWVAGYCNDMFGYVPSRGVLEEGGYEGGRSVLWSALPAPFAADTEARLMAAVRRLVGQL